LCELRLTICALLKPAIARTLSIADYATIDACEYVKVRREIVIGIRVVDRVDQLNEEGAFAATSMIAFIIWMSACES
jgi:hypothetical protein